MCRYIRTGIDSQACPIAAHFVQTCFFCIYPFIRHDGLAEDGTAYGFDIHLSRISSDEALEVIGRGVQANHKLNSILTV